MEVFLDAASWALLVAGAVVCVIAGIGMMRMPDFYTRSHAAGLADTLGAGLILLGLGLQAGLTLVTVKLFFVLMLFFITSPTSAHALVKSAYAHGVEAPAIEDVDATSTPPPRVSSRLVARAAAATDEAVPGEDRTP